MNFKEFLNETKDQITSKNFEKVMKDLGHDVKKITSYKVNGTYKDEPWIERDWTLYQLDKLFVAFSSQNMVKGGSSTTIFVDKKKDVIEAYLETTDFKQDKPGFSPRATKPKLDLNTFGLKPEWLKEELEKKFKELRK